MSSVPNQGHRHTVEEYLRRERDSLEKHEFRGGEIVLMAGGSGNHALIMMNIGGELRARLKGSPCAVYGPDLRIRIPRKLLYTYPDVTVICGERQLDPEDRQGETFTNPRVIVEVLSPTTEAYDRGEKFQYYLALESLEEYLLVSQTSPRVETFWRRAEGQWLFTPVQGLDGTVKLQSLRIELPLREIFAGVQWPAEEAVGSG